MLARNIGKHVHLLRHTLLRRAEMMPLSGRYSLLLKQKPSEFRIGFGGQAECLHRPRKAVT